MTEQFADKPCGTCGERHPVGAFDPGDKVVVAALDDDYDKRGLLIGDVGRVREWRAYPGNSEWVRVEFSDGHRANFDPCQLRLLEETPCR